MFRAVRVLLESLASPALVLAARQRAVTARLAELLQSKDDDLRQGLSPLLESGSIGMTRAPQS